MRLAVVSSVVILTALAAAGIAYGAAPVPGIDMCAINASTYSGDLNDNGFVAALPDRLAAGTVTCDRQMTERLGSADGRTYLLSQAWFTDTHDGAASGATVAQVAEIGASGQIAIVYRLSEIDSTDAVAAKLVTFDGGTVLAVTTPTQHLFLRGPDGFAPIDAELGEVSPDIVKASLPAGDVTAEPSDGHFLAQFNLDAFALDMPIAVASEVLPRPYANPDYDRPLTLRFPLQLKDGALVAGTGEVVEPDQYAPNGLGETPASFSVPKDIKACEIYASVDDTDPAGVVVRATPDSKGQIIATLPSGHQTQDSEEYSFGAEVDVIGSVDGWFLIENAKHPAQLYGESPDSAVPGAGSVNTRRAYEGRGWVHGSRLSTEIQSGDSLRASPDPKSKSVFDLKLDAPDNFAVVEGFKSCQGRAVELTVKRTDGVEGSGWIGGDGASVLCSNQATTCS